MCVWGGGGEGPTAIECCKRSPPPAPTPFLLSLAQHVPIH
jgi:hypothetical protein